MRIKYLAKAVLALFFQVVALIFFLSLLARASGEFGSPALARFASTGLAASWTIASFLYGYWGLQAGVTGESKAGYVFLALCPISLLFLSIVTAYSLFGA